MIKIDRGRGIVLAASTVVVSLMVSPALGQGFFDQLFGGSSAPQPYYNAPSTDIAPGFDDSESHHHHRKKRTAAIESDGKPELQKPTDLMSDKTLRYGDAVMMKDGLHIYKGPYAAKHSVDQFVSLDRSRQVSQTERAKLAALEVTKSAGVVEHRSSTDVVNGFKITDARGNSVRYVGP